MPSVSATVRLHAADGGYLRDVNPARIGELAANGARVIRSVSGRVRRIVLPSRDGESVLLRPPMPTPSTYREHLPAAGRQVVAMKRVCSRGCCLERWP